MSVGFTRAPAIFAAVLLCCALACGRRGSPPALHTKQEAAMLPPAGGTIARQVYPYSLIPGGVENASELQQHRADDRAIAEHYRDLGARIVPVMAKQDQWLYASYRVSDAIYWTKNRVLVHAGEGLFTDGVHLIRARCGNRLSDRPQSPVRAWQPPVVTTDRFTTRIETLPPPPLSPREEVPSIPAMPEIGPAPAQPVEQPVEQPETPPIIFVPPVPPPAVTVPPGEIMHPTPRVPLVPTAAPLPNTVIPEPGTALLMATGVSLLMVVRRCRTVTGDAVHRFLRRRCGRSG